MLTRLLAEFRSPDTTQRRVNLVIEQALQIIAAMRNVYVRDVPFARRAAPKISIIPLQFRLAVKAPRKDISSSRVTTERGRITESSDTKYRAEDSVFVHLRVIEPLL